MRVRMVKREGRVAQREARSLLVIISSLPPPLPLPLLTHLSNPSINIINPIIIRVKQQITATARVDTVD